jgi:hypothetical protein
MRVCHERLLEEVQAINLSGAKMLGHASSQSIVAALTR